MREAERAQEVEWENDTFVCFLPHCEFDKKEVCFVV